MIKSFGEEEFAPINSLDPFPKDCVPCPPFPFPGPIPDPPSSGPARLSPIRPIHSYHTHPPLFTQTATYTHKYANRCVLNSLHATGTFTERLAFKYLYALKKDSTAIWCSRQCACVVNAERGSLFFIFHFGFSNSLIIHKCISRVQRVKTNLNLQLKAQTLTN